MSVTEERLTLSSKELKRVQVLELIQAEHVTVVQAATLLGVSERHGWQPLTRYREFGAAGLVHGNRGRRPRPPA
jgi:molybdenum-dependent DNA-binding transcriptional regulator ModE